MKTIKKINLLLTVIGFTTFFLGNILQILNMNPEAEVEMVNGLNQMTYLGTIILGLSLTAWLIILEFYVFTDWNWLKTKTKGDDIAALLMFVVFAPILLSLIIFIFYDMVIYYDWYLTEDYGPMYDSIYGLLKHLEEKIEFWFIFITLFSISSGLAIFLYKAKTKKIEVKNQL